MRKATCRLIEAAEGGMLSWEAIARECLAQMSEDDVADVATALGWDDEDE